MSLILLNNNHIFVPYILAFEIMGLQRNKPYSGNSNNYQITYVAKAHTK